jgi:hypothetical protein
MRLRRLVPLALAGVVGALAVAPPAAAVATPLTLGAVSTLVAVPGSTAAFGDLTVTEDAAGRLKANDTVTFRFQDSASASTIHFGTVGTVGGTNGLTGKAKISSSSGTLLDQMVVTVTSPSSGAFPGVLTLAGLNPALDAGTALGQAKITVNHVSTGGNLLTNAPAPSDANMIGAATPKAVFKQQSTPPVQQTGTAQQIGNLVISEPTKSFFQAGDTLTFTVRDAQGSTDTVGLASTPIAIGGSMQVSVHGASTSSVQSNDTSFKVVVDAPDPSNGSTSAISVTNLYVNTARAPLGPVTVTAVLTTGAATEYLVPGRAVVAGVGGVTSTTSNGTPSVPVSGIAAPAGNVSVSAAAGSLANGEQITLTIQEPGVTFSTGAKAPIATVTNGDLVLLSAQATVGPDANAVANKVATFSIKTGNSKAATIVVGPIFYNIAGGTAGDLVTLAAAGSPGSAFVPENVDNALLAPAHPVASFTTSPAVLTPLSGAPWTGADVTITPVSPGSIAAGSSLYLLAPYASQIAAYRTTFAALPTVTGTGLGAPTLNTSAMVVQTLTGAVTAPAQTVLSIPVTGTPGTVTVSGIVYSLGAYVPPGHLVGTGSVVASGGSSAADGEQYVDLSNAKGLGSVSSTSSVPVVYFTQTPPSATTSTEATFTYYSDPTGANFACVLDGVAIGPCSSGWTYTGFSSGTHTFTVVPSSDTATGQPATYTWTVDNTAPTAAAPAGLASGALLTVTFSEAVLGAGTLSWADALTSAPVPGILSCKNGASVVPCNGAAGVTSASLLPAKPLIPGARYRVAVSYAPNLVTDLAGTPMSPVTFTTRASLSEEETSLAGVPAWRKVATASASGGSYAVSHQAGATLSETFTGTSAAWYAVRGPSFGTASVYVDGVFKKTFNGYATTVGYNVLGYSVTGLSNAKHMLMVRVNGAKGSTLGKDTLVAVDRFVVGSATVQQDGAGTRAAWRRVATSSASGGGYAVEDLAGAAFSMTFRGTGVSWYGSTSVYGGRAYVYVDNVLKATVSSYGSSTVYKKALYTTGGLSATATHTIRVVVVGTHVTGSKGNQVTVDRFGFA